MLASDPAPYVNPPHLGRPTSMGTSMMRSTVLRASLCALLLAACSDAGGGEKSAGSSSHDTQPWLSSDAAGADDGWSAGDTWSGAVDRDGSTDGSAQPTGNTNINLSGVQDFGFFRRLLDQGQVPLPSDLDAAGFFAEHHTFLPTPTCGERLCLQTILGAMGDLLAGDGMTLLQIGLNTPIIADASQRPPLALAVVVDTSGSMATDGKMTFVKQGLERLVNSMRDGDTLALITYASTVEVVAALGPVQGRRAELLARIADLQPGGGTNLHDGLLSGYQQLLTQYASGWEHRVVLLSDGRPTVGTVAHDAIVAMSALHNGDGIGLTSVGLGTDFNYELMRELAEQADGNFYFLEDATAVDEVFTEEIHYFTVPVAYDVTVTLQIGEDYAGHEVFGSHLWRDTPAGGSLSVPSVFLAQRVSPSDVGPGSERRGGGSALLVRLAPRTEDGFAVASAQVAEVTLSYREPGTDRVVTQSASVGYPYAPWTFLLSGLFEHAVVEKSFVMLNIYLAMRAACGLAHDGAPLEAIALLRRVRAAVVDYEDSANGGQGDVDMRLDVELMDQLVEVLATAAEVEPSEPNLPDDPWPADED